MKIVEGIADRWPVIHVALRQHAMAPPREAEIEVRPHVLDGAPLSPASLKDLAFCFTLDTFDDPDADPMPEMPETDGLAVWTLVGTVKLGEHLTAVWAREKAPPDQTPERRALALVARWIDGPPVSSEGATPADSENARRRWKKEIFAAGVEILNGLRWESRVRQPLVGIMAQLEADRRLNAVRDAELSALRPDERR